MNSENSSSRSLLRSIALPFKRFFSSEYAYLTLAFLIPALIMYLVYVAMSIRPFGDGSVLVLDMNAQYVYFFEALRNALYGEGSFAYTFSQALGSEFMGIYTYYLASPLSYIVALFPQSAILEAILTILLIKTGLCGASFAFYLHKHTKKDNKPIIIAFSSMYALCAYAVVYQSNTMWIDAMFWLPLVVYGVEQMIAYGKYKLYVITLCMTIMSNYYIGYMVCIFVTLYFVYYYFSSPNEWKNPYNERKHLLRSCIRFACFSLIAAAISAVVLFSAYYSLTFGKTTFSTPDWGKLSNFNFIHIFTKLLPASYDTIRPQGLPFIYCGILSLLCLPLFFVARSVSKKEKLWALALVAVLLFSFYLSPLDLIWHGFQQPNWLNARYSFMLCFFLLVIAYRGLGNIKRSHGAFITASAIVIIAFTLICSALDFETYIVSDGKIGAKAVVITVVAAVLLALCLIWLSHTKNRITKNGICAVIALVACVEMFASAVSFTWSIDDDVAYSTHSSYNSIGELRPVVNEIYQRDKSFYRAEKLMHRRHNDNMALGLRGLSGSTSTLNASKVRFLSNMGYSSLLHKSKFLGGTPVSNSLLGVKYIIDTEGSNKLDSYYESAFSVGRYNVYRNPNSLSIAYAVDSGINTFSFDAHDTYFEKQNKLVSAMCGSDDTIELYKPISDYTSNCEGAIIDTNEEYNEYSPSFKDKPAIITYSFVATKDAEYYFFTPSDAPTECAISVNDTPLGTYLGFESTHIVSLGNFKRGDEVTVKITLGKYPLTINNGCDYIWYLDDNAFESAFEKLKSAPQLVTDENCSDDHITGTITTFDDTTTVLTTIPYDKGWKLYVDGQKVEHYKTLDALIAFDVGSGVHTVELRYSPGVYWIGLTVSLISTATFVLLCVFDKRDKQKRDIYWTLESV
ncbi:MAG: hypothetical protein E7653_00965 [Ruminococcaceae bacterium]|nr:hypothetical protein [Oscillospiraceae bacterium]